MHRKDTLERQTIVHQRENRLLDLARVERAADQHFPARRVQNDKGAGARPVRDGIGLERGRVQDERLRVEVAQLVGGRIDEHRSGKERVVGVIRDDADGDAVLRVGAGEGVEDIEIPVAAEVRCDLFTQPLEMLLRDLGVDVAPPDPVLGARLANDELVLRRAARMGAGVDRE